MKTKAELTRLLIGYTISDDRTREEFKRRLSQKYRNDLIWVNESMYKLRGVGPRSLETTLTRIFSEIGEKDLIEGDFIK